MRICAVFCRKFRQNKHINQAISNQDVWKIGQKRNIFPLVNMKKNILALDLVKGSLGIAISRSGLFVSLLDNLRFQAGHYDQALTGLKKVIQNETIESIVIGWPLFPSGDPCEMTPIVENFISLLAVEFPGITIEKVDERNSTVEASGLLHDAGKAAKKQKQNIDSAAAGVILQRYLASIGQLN